MNVEQPFSYVNFTFRYVSLSTRVVFYTALHIRLSSWFSLFCMYNRGGMNKLSNEEERRALMGGANNRRVSCLTHH